MTSPLQAIKSAVPGLSGLRVLDIGCGEGAVVAQLAGEGAAPVGIDPLASAIEIARAANRGLEFIVGEAQSLPFADASFDVAVFVNSLHHVPLDHMMHALEEAARVTAVQGRVIVIEPLPQGEFFELVRLVEDETQVRLAAQETLQRFLAQGRMHLVSSHTYERAETFPDLAAFVRRVVSVDPSRAVQAQKQEAALAARFTQLARKSPSGWVFHQPVKVDVLARQGA